jgi:hypothetical protein
MTSNRNVLTTQLLAWAAAALASVGCGPLGTAPHVPVQSAGVVLPGRPLTTPCTLESAPRVLATKVAPFAGINAEADGARVLLRFLQQHNTLAATLAVEPRSLDAVDGTELEGPVLSARQGGRPTNGANRALPASTLSAGCRRGAPDQPIPGWTFAFRRRTGMAHPSEPRLRWPAMAAPLVRPPWLLPRRVEGSSPSCSPATTASSSLPPLSTATSLRDPRCRPDGLCIVAHRASPRPTAQFAQRTHTTIEISHRNQCADLNPVVIAQGTDRLLVR